MLQAHAVIAAFGFGAFWLGGIVTHWVPLAVKGPSSGDWTSFVSVPGGALFVLIGLALLRARSKPSAEEAAA